MGWVSTVYWNLPQKELCRTTNVVGVDHMQGVCFGIMSVTRHPSTFFLSSALSVSKYGSICVLNMVILELEELQTHAKSLAIRVSILT